MEKKRLDKDVPVTLLQLTSKTQNYPIYKSHDVTLFSLKSGKTKYEKGQRDRKNKKNKKSGENGRDERDKEDYCGNEVNPIVEKSSGFETSFYYHIIYLC